MKIHTFIELNLIKYWKFIKNKAKIDFRTLAKCF